MSQQVIKIRGRNVYLITENVEKIGDIDSFIKEFSAQESMDTGFLPRKCSRMIRNSRGEYYFFEFANPTGFGITVRDKESNNFITKYDLPSNFVYTIIVHVRSDSGARTLGNSYFICTTQSPRITEEVMAFHPPVPNIYEKLNICFGSLILRSPTLTGKVEEIVSQLVNGVWNLDLHEFCFSSKMKEEYTQRITEAQVKATQAPPERKPKFIKAYERMTSAAGKFRWQTNRAVYLAKRKKLSQDYLQPYRTWSALMLEIGAKG